MEPSPVVLRSFGASGAPELLDGGRGTSWHAGDVVLKPLDTSLEDLAWQERALAPLQGRGDVRVSAPLRSLGGELVVAGWTARRHLVGRSAAGAWADVADAGRRLGAALAHLPRPGHLVRRGDPCTCPRRWCTAT